MTTQNNQPQSMSDKLGLQPVKMHSIDLNNILGDNVGSIQLIQQCGNDKMIVNAARVSFGQDNNLPLDANDERLIKYLVRHRHTSPFEHNLLTVKVKAPLVIARQWMRHRIGVSYNEISGRYVELKDAEFYVPKMFRRQSASNRQASIDTDESNDPDPFGIYRFDMSKHFEMSLKLYNSMLESGICKEQARLILPQAMYTEFYFTCNLASLRHFIELREHSGAQWEIQQYAKGLKQIAMEFWPVAITALEANYD